MLYKNSVNLLTTNFGLAWKQLVYSLLCLAISVVSAVLFLGPVVDCLHNAGWIKEVATIFETVYVNVSEIGVVIETAFIHFFQIIAQNFSTVWVYFALMFFVSYVLPVVLLNYSQFILAKVVGDQMSSLMQSGYTKTLFESGKQGMLYAIAKCVYDLVGDIESILEELDIGGGV
jgi:hypothetical protein